MAPGKYTKCVFVALKFNHTTYKKIRLSIKRTLKCFFPTSLKNTF